MRTTTTTTTTTRSMTTTTTTTMTTTRRRRRRRRAEGNEDEDRGRQITSYAGELLRARAAAGKLDPRTADRLLPVLETPEKFEHRRRAVVEILGALRHRAAVPALIKILEETTIKSSLDSIGKEDFVAATAAALGAIGDPAAIPALASVVAAPGTHNDKPRPVAADALAACLAAIRHRSRAPLVDDAVLARAARRRSASATTASSTPRSHFAYGRIARQLPPERRAEARRRLLEADSARDDAIADARAPGRARAREPDRRRRCAAARPRAAAARGADVARLRPRLHRAQPTRRAARRRGRARARRSRRPRVADAVRRGRRPRSLHMRCSTSWASRCRRAPVFDRATARALR